MKTYFIPQNDKISFCDNIFYWLWHNTPKRGFPDRTFAIIAVLQFSYIVFFVMILLILLNIVIERSIADSFELLSSPLFILFVSSVPCFQTKITDEHLKYNYINKIIAISL